MKKFSTLLTAEEVELSRQNFTLEAHKISDGTASHRFLAVDFNEIAKRDFPNALPRFFVAYHGSSNSIKSFLNEEFSGLQLGKYYISVLDQTTEDKKLKNLKPLDDLLVLIYFAAKYRISVGLERARFYQMCIEHGLEQHITISTVHYVSDLLEVDHRTLEKDIKNANFN